MLTERRKSRRIPKEFSATLERVATLRGAEESRFIRVKIIDVSREGIGFISPEPFDRDAFVRVVVSMSLDEGKAATGRLFITSAAIRNCAPEKKGGYHVQASYKVGALLKEQSGLEHTGWHELIRQWEPMIT